MQLKAKGKLRVSEEKIYIETNVDFCKYYAWLYKKATWNTQKINLPAHGAHINISNPKIHGKLNLAKYKYLNNKEVEFIYNIEGNFGGFQKGFLNFWLDIECNIVHSIASELGILKETKGFSPFHITIFNTKNL